MANDWANYWDNTGYIELEMNLEGRSSRVFATTIRVHPKFGINVPSTGDLSPQGAVHLIKALERAIEVHKSFVPPLVRLAEAAE